MDLQPMAHGLDVARNSSVLHGAQLPAQIAVCWTWQVRVIYLGLVLHIIGNP